jgi:hypothetical protein
MRRWYYRLDENRKFYHARQSRAALQQFSIQNLTLQGKDAMDFRKVTKE